MTSTNIPGRRPCYQCHSVTFYNDEYDAYFCTKCDMWLEKRCGSLCEFCTERPETPSKAIHWSEFKRLATNAKIVQPLFKPNILPKSIGKTISRKGEDGS